MAAKPATTIVTAVESGALEQQVVLLAESLRRFGGQWADLPFWAVQPRRGPSLEPVTVERLKRLGVTYVRENRVGQYAWWNHFNKVAAMEYAESRVGTDHVTWLDTDMVIVREPDDFRPVAGTEFVARAGEGCDIASNGRDGAAAFWRELCRRYGMDFDEFPEVTSFPDGKRIKAYFQTGYYSYPVSSRFSAKHRKVFEAMLDGHVKSRVAGTFHTDQASVALTVQLQEMSFSTCDPRMNFNLNVTDPKNADAIEIEEIKIIQYHGSFWPENMRWADTYIDRLPSEVQSLIRAHAPWRPARLRKRMQSRFWSESRKRRVRCFERGAVAL